MVNYSTSDFKPGLKIIIDNDPCEIIEEDFVKPGKGQAFSKVKFRNLLTGRVGEKTCKVGESIESADVEELEMQFLYLDGDSWVFMHPENFEQISINQDLIGTNKDWLSEGDICQVILWNQQPISVVPPVFVNLEITKTDPGVKGDTASGGSKPATLSTGAIIKVPLFISEGEIVTIDTRNGEYQGRA
ncbi:MAG: elongation factor P [Gammaproteobacteria bacterium]|jgi:elongation factor P|nr:elongation factor P [Gammaproteobacteria bacterium]GIS33545.1 MAG: elongation factor P [Gammaproteobacteria bacterium]|tara:strand:+ start:2905 stop:3468 length:564 start_codon:yes stop_codon:yes gene_type:complete